VLLTNLLPPGPKYMYGPCSLWWEQPAHVVSFCVSVSGQGEVFLLKELMLITGRDPASSWEQQQPLALPDVLRGCCHPALSGNCLGGPGRRWQQLRSGLQTLVALLCASRCGLELVRSYFRMKSDWPSCNHSVGHAISHQQTAPTWSVVFLPSTPSFVRSWYT